MRFLFIGVYADQNITTFVNKNSKTDGAVSVAATKYSRLIVEGLQKESDNKCTNLFLVPIGMYPLGNILFWYPKIKGENCYIPFVNIIILKQICISFYILFFSTLWYFKHSGENRHVVFSCIYLPFLIGISPIKIFGKIFITTFVPDLPDFEFSYTKTSRSLKSVLVPFYILLSKKIISLSDYFVFITKYMKDCFSERPYSIIEGFVESNINKINMINNVKKNAIMYAGGLFEKYGIILLLNAFLEIKGDYELWLFGNSDMEKKIIHYTKLDSRIKYFGLRSNSEIESYEKMAKLLVNPRPTNHLFTKFSFPSKLMEYMASGTPVLTTRLPGIPKDYDDKMFFINEETVEGLKTSLLNVLIKPHEELEEFGKYAQSYVLKEKNNVFQIKKLINKLSDLTSK